MPHGWVNFLLKKWRKRRENFVGSSRVRSESIPSIIQHFLIVHFLLKIWSFEEFPFNWLYLKRKEQNGSTKLSCDVFFCFVFAYCAGASYVIDLALLSNSLALSSNEPLLSSPINSLALQDTPCFRWRCYRCIVWSDGLRRWSKFLTKAPSNTLAYDFSLSSSILEHVSLFHSTEPISWLYIFELWAFVSIPIRLWISIVYYSVII